LNTKIQTSKEATNVKNLLETVGEVSCPVCGKAITTHEYDRATHEFRKRMEQAYKDRFDKYRRGFEDQLLEQEKKHRLEIESMKKARLHR
jgi:uncharacterized Zn finger protein (UPF0148 family)